MFPYFLQDVMEIRHLVSKEWRALVRAQQRSGLDQPSPNFWLHLGDECRCHLAKDAALSEGNMPFISIFGATWTPSRS